MNNQVKKTALNQRLEHQIQVMNEVINAESYNLGDAFFEFIVAKLNTALGADYTFIGTLDEGEKSVSTVTLYGDGQYLESFTYELAHTPCENVVGNNVCYYEKGITELFPKDELLIQMGIEGYVGVPTFNSKKEPTGIIVSLFKNAIEDTDLAKTILMLFATRVGAELEHNILYNNLNELQSELASKNAELILHQQHLEQLVSERTAELEKTIERLKNTKSRLIQAEKHASLGIMTAGVAHEINNPLNFIMGGYTGLKEILLEQYSLDNAEHSRDVQTLLNSVKSGVERIDKIVSSLHEFSNTSDNIVVECDIHEILDNCLSFLPTNIIQNCSIEKYYGTHSIKLTANSGQLHQVFLNILTNASQAINANSGTIKIYTTSVTNGIEVRIKDNGVGISEINLPKIFDPFFTTKSPGKGTGLGLSIAYSLVQKHNGTLKINSEVNNGTEVTIMIPT